MLPLVSTRSARLIGARSVALKSTIGAWLIVFEDLEIVLPERADDPMPRIADHRRDWHDRDARAEYGPRLLGQQ